MHSLLAEVTTENAAVRGLFDSLANAGDAWIDGDATEPREMNIPESYQVVVECRDEQEQQTMFERLRAEGHRCRVLTL